MEMLFQFLDQLGPVLAGILTVPALQLLKKASGAIDRTPPLVKQLIAVVIAFVLTQLGSFLDVSLPGELSLFTGTELEAAIAAGIAYGVHAGKKAHENEETSKNAPGGSA